MYAKTIASRLFTTHGPAIFELVQTRRDFYSDSLKYWQDSPRAICPPYVPKYLARRLLWDSVLSHLHRMIDTDSSLSSGTIRRIHS